MTCRVGLPNLLGNNHDAIWLRTVVDPYSDTNTFGVHGQ
jgi:hypothetical protein